MVTALEYKFRGTRLKTTALFSLSSFNVDQLSNRSSWALEVKGKLSPSSGFVALKHLNPIHNPAGICMLKVNNRNTRKACEICPKLTIKTPERHQKICSQNKIQKGHQNTSVSP